MRKVILSSGQIYHIFNVGVEKRPTFTDKKEYDRALLTLDYYRYDDVSTSLSEVLKLNLEEREIFLSEVKKRKKMVDILGYCFMPNHFHFLIKQLIDSGISTFVGNFSNSYTKYFNIKRGRVGHLFQGVFKAVRIEDDEQLIHVLRYIHINPVVSSVIAQADLEKYPYSSFSEYLDNKDGICNKELITSHFSSKEKLKIFTFDQIDYGRRLESIKHLTLE